MADPTIPNRRKNDAEYITRGEFDLAVNTINGYFNQINNKITEMFGLIQTVISSQNNILNKFNEHQEEEDECRGRVERLFVTNVKEESSRKTVVWMGKLVTGVIVILGIITTAIYHFISIVKP